MRSGCPCSRQSAEMNASIHLSMSQYSLSAAICIDSICYLSRPRGCQTRHQFENANIMASTQSWIFTLYLKQRLNLRSTLPSRPTQSSTFINQRAVIGVFRLPRLRKRRLSRLQAADLSGRLRVALLWFCGHHESLRTEVIFPRQTAEVREDPYLPSEFRCVLGDWDKLLTPKLSRIFNVDFFLPFWSCIFQWQYWWPSPGTNSAYRHRLDFLAVISFWGCYFRISHLKSNLLRAIT